MHSQGLALHMIESAKADSVASFPQPRGQTWTDEFDMLVTTVDRPLLCLGDYGELAASKADVCMLKMWWGDYVRRESYHVRNPPLSCKDLEWSEVRAALLRTHPDKCANDSASILKAVSDLRKYRENRRSLE